MESHKRVEIKMFSSSKDIHPFIMRDFWSSFLSQFFLFVSFLFIIFSAPSLYLEILKIFEEKTNFNFFWMGWKLLHHEYESQEVVDILTVGVYSKIGLKRFQNSRRTHHLTKLNTHKSWYVDNYLAFVEM